MNWALWCWKKHTRRSTGFIWEPFSLVHFLPGLAEFSEWRSSCFGAERGGDTTVSSLYYYSLTIMSMALDGYTDRMGWVRHCFSEGTHIFTGSTTLFSAIGDGFFFDSQLSLPIHKTVQGMGWNAHSFTKNARYIISFEFFFFFSLTSLSISFRTMDCLPCTVRDESLSRTHESLSMALPHDFLLEA